MTPTYQSAALITVMAKATSRLSMRPIQFFFGFSVQFDIGVMLRQPGDCGELLWRRTRRG